MGAEEEKAINVYIYITISKEKAYVMSAKAADLLFYFFLFSSLFSLDSF